MKTDGIKSHSIDTNSCSNLPSSKHTRGVSDTQLEARIPLTVTHTENYAQFKLSSNTH